MDFGRYYSHIGDHNKLEFWDLDKSKHRDHHYTNVRN